MSGKNFTEICPRCRFITTSNEKEGTVVKCAGSIVHFTTSPSSCGHPVKVLGVIGQSETTEHDPVNHPKHYTDHPSGVECIQITEHMGFNLGNAVKYIWRSDLKHDAIEDLKKAKWYIERELAKRAT